MLSLYTQCFVSGDHSCHCHCVGFEAGDRGSGVARPSVMSFIIIRQSRFALVKVHLFPISVTVILLRLFALFKFLTNSSFSLKQKSHIFCPGLYCGTFSL